VQFPWALVMPSPIEGHTVLLLSAWAGAAKAIVAAAMLVIIVLMIT
jgi:hypothetical protein